jgi:hypothetical protein
MSMLRKLGLVALVIACCPWSVSQAGVVVGVRFGGPCYRPYWGYGFYRPYPLFIGPAVVVQPAPIYVQPAIVQPTVVQPAYPSPASPPATQQPAPLPPPTPLTASDTAPNDVRPAVATTPNRRAEIDGYLQQLRTGDEQARAEALVRLGRLKAERAVGPMIKALNKDGSPQVREAAARGLGLVAVPSSLSALQYAAQADDDREVRRSASFAAEVIRGQLQRGKP